MGSLKSALYARMEEMSFRSGTAVAGVAVAVAGGVIALAVVLSGHTAAATSGPSPGAAVRLATPGSSAPASATSAAPAATQRASRSAAPQGATGSYSQTPSPYHASATPQPSASAPPPSPRSTLWQPRPPKWTPGDPRRPGPPDWGWPGLAPRSRASRGLTVPPGGRCFYRDCSVSDPDRAVRA